MRSNTSVDAYSPKYLKRKVAGITSSLKCCNPDTSSDKWRKEQRLSLAPHPMIEIILTLYSYARGSLHKYL
jgi:hypothetical protein